MTRLLVLAYLVVNTLVLFPYNFAFAQLDVTKSAVVRGLDKITARITTFNLPLGKAVKFGTLQIVARTCHKQPPEETPEVSVFLEIDEKISDKGDLRTIFTGWMFASSPALSALEHSVYDVWVIDCSTTAGVSVVPKELKSPASDKAAANRE